jgi:hypothetical protein
VQKSTVSGRSLPAREMLAQVSKLANVWRRGGYGSWLGALAQVPIPKSQVSSLKFQVSGFRFNFEVKPMICLGHLTTSL